MSKQHVRGFLSSSLLTLLILTTPLMLWKALTIITGSPHPIVVVISQSMAPAFNRGDLLFLWNRQPWVSAGEIPVCWFPGSPLPMVHRAVKAITLDGMRQQILTKGDNNVFDDVALYPPGQLFANREDIVGLVKGFLPGLGWLAIWLQENPLLTGIAAGSLALLAASQNG